MAIFCNNHKITVIPLFYGSVTLQRIGRFEPDNTVPKEKTLNPASFSNVAISFIGSPFLALSYYNLAWNATKILPIRILPRASTNPASAFSSCPSYKDTARQVSKPCRACPLFVKHRFPIYFRSPISAHGHRASICPPQKIFPCIICFSSHGPPAVGFAPPGYFWPPSPPAQTVSDNAALPRRSMALGSFRNGAAGSKTGC